MLSRQSILAAVVSLLISATSAVPASTTASAAVAQGTANSALGRSDAACRGLAALQNNQTFEENTSTYQNQTAIIWSQTCLAEPSCVFLPRSAQELAAGLRVILATGSEFTVRSGGHMPVPGANSQNSSVFISLSALNTRTLNADRSVASIGPGQTWGDVYNWLGPQGLAVNGGRYGSVGVGGLLIGGGIGYFASTKGWGADTVIGYEVVLPDSRVVYATRTAYSDLFWALKGGSNNFGIVTRFDMQTFPVRATWTGATIWTNASLEPFFNAVNSYLVPGSGVDDTNAAISMIVASTPQTKTVEGIFIGFYPGSNPSPPPFQNFSTIPGPTLLNDRGVRDSYTYLPNFLAEPSISGRGSRQEFYSFSFKADPRAIAIVNQTVITEGLTALEGVDGCALTLTYQPVSRAWLQAARASGGDAIDLDPADGTFIAGLISTTWNNAVDDARVLAFNRQAQAKIDAQLKPLGLYYPFIYLNDASPGQDPYPLYGENGSSLRRLGTIQQRYDPVGFFSRQLGKGFPLR